MHRLFFSGTDTSALTMGLALIDRTKAVSLTQAICLWLTYDCQEYGGFTQRYTFATKAIHIRRYWPRSNFCIR